MKVAFFIQGKRVPSSRFRVLQYVPLLVRQGVQCDIFPPMISKMGASYRFLPGFTYHIVRRVTQLFFYLPSRVFQISTAKLRDYDVIVIQKALMEWPASAFLERYIATKNPNIIFDIDDAEFTRVAGQSGRYEQALKELVALSKLVVTGNDYLADGLRTAAKRVIVLPTTVDETRFAPRCLGRKQGKICIGWTGTASNFRYLFDLLTVFEAFRNHDDVKFKIISNRDHIPELSHIENIEFCRWRESTEVQDLQEFDIGLMPLRDDPWTRGKCAFKLIQYMAVEIPSIVSPVGANQDVLIDNETGFFADGSQEWIDKLNMLITDKRLRARLGMEARDRFLREYSLRSNVVTMIEEMHKLALI